LFKYFVVSFLYKQIREQKIYYAGEPRLKNIELEPGSDARFNFELTLFPNILLQEWKHFPFKAPKRKNYKDLDRQVVSFIEEEKERLRTVSENGLEVGDWALFEVSLTDNNYKSIVEPHKEALWIRLGNEDADSSLRELFLNKKPGTIIDTDNIGLQEYFNNQTETNYNFTIEIKDALENSFFCLEHLKKYFKLKTNKEIHQKLIEIFSSRNDLSLRRSIVEEALKLLVSKHRFDIPKHLVLRQQKNILDSIQMNPDYQVYRMQYDFQEKVRMLAEKQAKEQVLLDQLAYDEGIEVTDCDVKGYLNLINRPRTKEFIYFDPPETKIRGQEMPIPSEELKHACLREKALNHLIYQLTKP